MANVLCISHEWNLGFDELRELANAGLRVIPSTSAFDAIKQFATRDIDAIIVNRRLPDIEVADLITFFRHHAENIPIVMLSNSMPVQNAPAEVDALMGKHNCAALLVPTLEVLMKSTKKANENDEDWFAQAA
jgi:DNA-binding response OmpR family regulator